MPLACCPCSAANHQFFIASSIPHHARPPRRTAGQYSLHVQACPSPVYTLHMLLASSKVWVSTSQRWNVPLDSQTKARDLSAQVEEAGL